MEEDDEWLVITTVAGFKSEQQALEFIKELGLKPPNSAFAMPARDFEAIKDKLNGNE